MSSVYFLINTNMFICSLQLPKAVAVRSAATAKAAAYVPVTRN